MSPDGAFQLYGLTVVDLSDYPRRGNNHFGYWRSLVKIRTSHSASERERWAHFHLCD